jgi:hypothetical protein
MNNLADSVVWVSSYPKSGNTFMQSIIRCLGKKFNFRDSDIDVYNLIINKINPDVYIYNGFNNNISILNKTALLKTHSLPPASPFNNIIIPNINNFELRLKTVGFIYIIRNPLDMLLSYINYTRVWYKNATNEKALELYNKLFFTDMLGFKEAPSIDKWLKTTLDDIPKSNLDNALMKFIEYKTEIPTHKNMTGGSWVNHCLSWLEASQKLPSVIIRYEDLIKGPEHIFRIKSIFKASEDDICESYSSANSRIMSARERKPSHKIMFNKMTSFYYKYYFSRELIEEFLMSFEGELKLLGYSDLYESY